MQSKLRGCYGWMSMVWAQTIRPKNGPPRVAGVRKVAWAPEPNNVEDDESALIAGRPGSVPKPEAASAVASGFPRPALSPRQPPS